MERGRPAQNDLCHAVQRVLQDDGGQPARSTRARAGAIRECDRQNQIEQDLSTLFPYQLQKIYMEHGRRKNKRSADSYL